MTVQTYQDLYLNLPRRYKSDINTLVMLHGDLREIEGHKLVYTLQEFGRICERDQLKVSAYSGLIAYLQRQFSLTLVLTSRKTKEKK